MKREGRQHGMVRTHGILQMPTDHPIRTINLIESIPAAGIFENVKSLKPTNQSKFTGKCRKVRCSDCHLNPASKSRDKCKGSLKLRGENDGFLRLRLLTWRVVDERLGLGVSFAKSSSASEILGELEGGENDVVECGVEFDDVEMDGGYEFEIQDEWMDGGDEEDETMSFCEVGYVWEQVDGDDDSWCLVAEM